MLTCHAYKPYEILGKIWKSDYSNCEKHQLCLTYETLEDIDLQENRWPKAT